MQYTLKQMCSVAHWSPTQFNIQSTHTCIPSVPLRFVYSLYLVAGLAPTMLSITNDQRMGELEQLLTSNPLSITVPAGLEFVLIIAPQCSMKTFHLLHYIEYFHLWDASHIEIYAID